MMALSESNLANLSAQFLPFVENMYIYIYIQLGASAWWDSGHSTKMLVDLRSRLTTISRRATVLAGLG